MSVNVTGKVMSSVFAVRRRYTAETEHRNVVATYTTASPYAASHPHPHPDAAADAGDDDEHVPWR